MSKESLITAVRRGQADKVKRILSSAEGQEDVHPDLEADPARNCLLHRAARNGHRDTVRVLVDCNADPNRTNKFGMTPLHHAAVEGDPQIVKTLLDAGGNPDLADDQGRVPLHWVAVYGFVDVAEILVEQARCKVEVPDKPGWTPLHRCCQEKPPEQRNPNAPPADPEKEPDPLELLSEEDGRRSAVATILLKAGAKAMAREPAGLQTPLHLCGMNGFAKTARVLIQRGKADVNARNKISLTPLMYACGEQHLGMVKCLLDFKADLTAEDKYHHNWTALHKAIFTNNRELVKILLKAGADKETKDAMGRNAATIAGDHYKNDVLDLLK